MGKHHVLVNFFPKVLLFSEIGDEAELGLFISYGGASTKTAVSQLGHDSCCLHFGRRPKPFLTLLVPPGQSSSTEREG